jgi:hypothetical protein
MNAMRRPRGAAALAVLVTIVPAMTGACLLAGCTSSGGGTVTTPVSTSPASTAPAGSTPGGSTPASSSPAGAAASVEAAALASLKAGSTVHVDIRSVDASGTVTTYSDEATATGGKQVIAIGSDQHATILYIDGVGYVQGNEPALAGFLGVPRSQAAVLAGRWISFKPGDTLGSTSYNDLVAGITLSSVATEIQLPGPDTETGPVTVEGQSVRAIGSPAGESQQLPSSARMTLYVTTSGARPVLERLSGGGGTQYQISFSRWGETVHLTPPQDALPVSSLGSPVLA